MNVKKPEALTTEKFLIYIFDRTMTDKALMWVISKSLQTKTFHIASSQLFTFLKSISMR